MRTNKSPDFTPIIIFFLFFRWATAMFPLEERMGWLGDGMEFEIDVN